MNKAKFDHLEPVHGNIEPVHGNIMQEDEVIQLLDVEDDLEEGELPSDIDEAILDEQESTTCSNCEVWIRYDDSYICMADRKHIFCNKCT